MLEVLQRIKQAAESGLELSNIKAEHITTLTPEKIAAIREEIVGSQQSGSSIRQFVITHRDWWFANAYYDCRNGEGRDVDGWVMEDRHKCILVTAQDARKKGAAAHARTHQIHVACDSGVAGDQLAIVAPYEWVRDKDFLVANGPDNNRLWRIAYAGSYDASVEMSGHECSISSTANPLGRGEAIEIDGVIVGYVHPSTRRAFIRVWPVYQSDGKQYSKTPSRKWEERLELLTSIISQVTSTAAEDTGQAVTITGEDRAQYREAEDTLKMAIRASEGHNDRLEGLRSQLENAASRQEQMMDDLRDAIQERNRRLEQYTKAMSDAVNPIDSMISDLGVIDKLASRSFIKSVDFDTSGGRRLLSIKFHPYAADFEDSKWTGIYKENIMSEGGGVCHARIVPQAWVQYDMDNGAVRLMNNHVRGRDVHSAPHQQSDRGRACWGDIAPAIAEARANKDIIEMVDWIAPWLFGIRPNDPLVKPWTWKPAPASVGVGWILPGTEEWETCNTNGLLFNE